VNDADYGTTIEKNITRGTASGSSVWRLLGLIVFVVVVAVVGVRLFKPAETPFDKAVALVRQGKAAAALPVLEQLSMQHPANPAVFPWLAQGYLATDRIAEGRIALDTALRMGLPPSSLAPTIILYANF
jgi:hypothetical protein